MNNVNIINEKIIPNKSVAIPIVYKKLNESNYDVKCSFFDPNHSSPPNYFINKLITRLNTYDLQSPKKNLSLYNK